ncbi:uncharacterized protein LOC128558521 [Mercenaria mercenaria]|uniref:uncharacterized protein LOC128558521 n=1 Tax=Mercenaria mercenaria TaxID=6596 RepID=UPI00234EF60E|nr:uncharacterized protein LOC128558521 [Mercenaria mercenaria]
MGNSASGEDHTDYQVDPHGIEKLRGSEHFQNLPKIFGQHYNHVLGFTEATRAQQKLVDRLSAIPTVEGAEQDTFPSTVMKNGLDILKDFQSARYRQSDSLYESLMELYHNIQGIFESCGLKHFPFDCSHPEEYYQQSGNKQNQRRVVSQSPAGTLAPLVQKELQQQETIKKLEKKVTTLDERIVEAENIYKIKNVENKMLKEEIGKLKKTENELCGYIKRLTKENEDLQQKVIKLQPPKISATIQLLHSHSGNTIKDIEAELKTMLKHQLNSVDFIKFNKPEDVDPSKMLIVLSIIASRVGTDAANAIKGIENPENTALLLFHIKESHALTKQASTSVLTDQTFKALGGIFDMAFVNGKGIYQCEMNDIALEGVCTFIRCKFMK